jgi:hypothetical protein
LDALHAASEAKARELSNAIKAQVAGGDHGLPNATVRSIIEELHRLQTEYRRGLRRLQRSVGVSQAEMAEVERAYLAERLPRGNDYWLEQVHQVRPTEDLDAQAAVGLEQLLRLVDPSWLDEEARKTYRLGRSYLTEPLHAMNGVRVGLAQATPGPQRFARMLLVCQDHLNKEPTLDFFSAAMFVPEVAALGNNLAEINALGKEATRKLHLLPTMTDDMVTSTIYELLVGAACLRRGLNVEMVTENRAQKVPDYRITGIGAIPGAIECKRRLGLTHYELQEARHVEALYAEARPHLRKRGIHSSVEASFAVPVASVLATEFCDDVLSIARHDQDIAVKRTRWGTLTARRLPFWEAVPETRLYSPDFLREVFDWDPAQMDWDGLLCEVEPPNRIIVSSYVSPLCLKWKSESEEALTKRSRGITSLWADAVKQIPDGELGFIYIAYPEGARAVVADARTRHILGAMQKSWHRWSVRIPVTVISRLYARPVGGGCPDLIESALPGAAEGQEFWLTKLPRLIFAREE